MMAMATISEKLTITAASPMESCPTPPLICASPTSSDGRPLDGASATSRRVVGGTSNRPPASNAAMDA
jgi:hypothetical protein